MFWLRSCPRCRGDLYQDRDPFGYYLKCLQCGQEVQLARRLGDEEELSSALMEEVPITPDASQLLAD